MELPLDRSLLQAAKRRQRAPYIYSQDDIRQLFTAARQWTSCRVPLRHLTLQAMLALAYGAGLRLGELVRLTLGDLDLTQATIEIRDTKFFKSRRLPLSPTVMSTLQQYLTARRQAGASETADSALFWNEQHRRGYALVTAEHLLTRVIRRAGLKPERGRIGPRVHDLRHYAESPVMPHDSQKTAELRAFHPSVCGIIRGRVLPQNADQAVLRRAQNAKTRHFTTSAPAYQRNKGVKRPTNYAA
jgi:integrase